MSGDVTISGEVHTDQEIVDRAESDLLVRRKILEIAGVFALWMEKNVAGEHDDARTFLKRTTGML